MNNNFLIKYGILKATKTHIIPNRLYEYPTRIAKIYLLVEFACENNKDLVKLLPAHFAFITMSTTVKIESVDVLYYI